MPNTFTKSGGVQQDCSIFGAVAIKIPSAIAVGFDAFAIAVINQTIVFAAHAARDGKWFIGCGFAVAGHFYLDAFGKCRDGIALRIDDGAAIG